MHVAHTEVTIIPPPPCMLLTRRCWVADIVRRSGVMRGHDSTTGGSNGKDQATSAPQTVQDAVDHAMRRLANYLLLGNIALCLQADSQCCI